MTIALPLPYEDELLYSNIGRYMELLAVNKPTAVIRALFGRFVFPSADLVCSLDELARQTYDSWGLSSKEIADRYTPLPYYASYASDRARAQVYAAIASGGETRATPFLGQTKSRVVGPVKFRFCVQCAREDIANYGETYWHRSFQLPGVVVCPKHRRSLRESSFHTKPQSSIGWYTGNSAITALIDDDTEKNALWNGNLSLLEVAIRSIDLLGGTTKSFSAMDAHYLSLAQAVGVTRPSGIVDSDVLSREMRAMYGEDFLKATGLFDSEAKTLKWPKDMMRRHGASFQPLQHILLGYFLECCATSVRKGGQAVLTARQNFTCPNRYATHGAGHVIERMKVKETADGRVGMGHCSCGLKFSFRHCRTGTLEPEIIRINDFGKDWREKVREMRRGKRSFAEIAMEMGLTVSCVKSMALRRYGYATQAIETKIVEWRREWERLLECVSPLGHEAASKMDPTLYRRLNRHDSVWLRESNRRCRLQRKHRRSRTMADWENRDKAWEQALKSAADKLYASPARSRRVSEAAIISEANVHQLDRHTLNRLPLCRATLVKSTESLEQFAIYRLARAAQYLFDHGESITAGKLFRRAYISEGRRTPVILAVIERLLEKYSERPLQG